MASRANRLLRWPYAWFPRVACHKAMLKILSDNEINSLILERKAIPNGLVPLSKLMERNKH